MSLTTAPVTIDALIRTEMPPLSATVSRVTSMTQDPNASQRSIANVISLDPLLASRILRLANSPIYAHERSVSNLVEAVTTVGNSALTGCLLMTSISGGFGKSMLDRGHGKRIWQTMLHTAMAADDTCVS